MKYTKHLSLFLLLSVLSISTAYAASTRIKLESETTGVGINETAVIEMKLCTDETVNTLDISVDLSESTADFTAEAKGNNNALQIITEKSFDTDTMIARLVGGNPGNIIMEEDGCALVGSIELTALSEGVIVAAIDFEETQLIGENTFDTTEAASLENESKIELTVGTETTAATTEVTTEEATQETEEQTNELTIETTSGSAALQWEPVENVMKYIVQFNTKEAYETDNTDLRSLEILGAANSRYTLAALEANTEYVAMVKMVGVDGAERDLIGITPFTTKEVPVETIVAHDAAITDPRLTVDTTTPTTITPQPVAYIVQEPESEQFTHAASGPEHIVLGIIGFVLIGWVYIRKKLA